MAFKLAFMGIRHYHILDLHRLAQQTDGVEIAAACEEDAAARKALPDTVKVTHDSYRKMLEETPCDAIAVGDHYGKRGRIIIEALRRGKHVISDKPICTDMAELDEIENLAREKKLSVGCQLDMVYSPNIRAVRELIVGGRLGAVHQVAIGGQHPLNYGVRPMWYFEPGKHGGTINDIAIHAFHMLPWMTGRKIDTCIAARTWNAFATQAPHFPDSAQMMLTLDGGCGVMIDVSYAMPASHGYGLPQYWRSTWFGSKGIAETSSTMDHVAFYEEGRKQAEIIKPTKVEGDNYLLAFLSEVQGGPVATPMRTRDILAASRVSLKVQQAADQNQRDVKL